MTEEQREQRTLLQRLQALNLTEVVLVAALLFVELGLDCG